MTGFKVYKGTKETFISSGKDTSYANAIVFITGGTDASKSCIFAQGTYFANFTEFIAAYVSAMNYVKGINVGGNNYNAATGGGYVAFSAKDPSTVAVNANSNGIEIGLTDAFINKVNQLVVKVGADTDAADADGSIYARIANLSELVGNLTGDSTDSIAKQITGAIESLRSDILGTLDETDAKTLAAINDELDAIDAKWTNYVTKTDLANLGGTANGGTTVKVTVTSEGGEVKTVTVDETALTGALAEKANTSDVYTKTEIDTTTNALGARITTEAPVTIEEAAGTGSILKTYTFTQNGKTIGTINLAKDLVVSSGEVKMCTLEGQGEVKCLELTLTSGDVVHIPVNELVDVYTAGNYITIGTDNKISVNKDEIVAGLATTESVTEAINKEVARADAAYDAKGAADTAKSDAITEAGKLATAAETAAKAYADGLAVNYDAAGSAASAESKAKAYADSLASNYATAEQGAKADAAAPQATTYTKAEVDAMWAWEELV